MRLALLILLALLTGCAGPLGNWSGPASSTPTDFINAIAKDTGSNCFNVSIPVYGGGFNGARAGGPGTKVVMQGGTCTIETQFAPPQPGTIPLVPAQLLAPAPAKTP